MKYKLLADPETHQIEIAHLDEEEKDKQVIGYIESEWETWELMRGFKINTIKRANNIHAIVREARKDLDAAYDKLCVALEK